MVFGFGSGIDIGIGIGILSCPYQAWDDLNGARVTEKPVHTKQSSLSLHLHRGEESGRSRSNNNNNQFSPKLLLIKEIIHELGSIFSKMGGSSRG